MPAKINKETINNSNSLEVLDQKIKELETSLTSLKEDQNILKSKIKPYKDNSVSCITKDGTRELIGDWDIGNNQKILVDEIRARDGDGLKLFDDGGKGIFVKDGGYVGIGTNDPGRDIDIYNSTLYSDVGFHVDTVLGNAVCTLKSNTANKMSFLEFEDRSVPIVCGMVGMDRASNIISGGGARNDMFLTTYWGSTNKVHLATNMTARLTVDRYGKIGINISSPTCVLDINTNKLRLRIAKTPASAGAAGNQGDFCWDVNFIYICTATNTWKRAAIAAW